MAAAAAAAPLSLVWWCTATILYEEQLVDGVSEFRGEREESTGGLVCCHARSEEGKNPSLVEPGMRLRRESVLYEP